MRNYDGSVRWSEIESTLERDGYGREFSCATFDRVPTDVGYTGLETGWELRRKLKAYCGKNGIEDFKLVRNTSYHRDLYGSAVYELWVRQRAPAPE